MSSPGYNLFQIRYVDVIASQLALSNPAHISEKTRQHAEVALHMSERNVRVEPSKEGDIS